MINSLTIFVHHHILSFFYHCLEPWEIIVYSRGTINVYSLLSHEWWVSLIKFMVGLTIHVRG